MIITKTPFRISFCGGGSDLPAFYRKYGGCVLSTTINKYIYLAIHPYFNEDYTSLKYSENELVNENELIQHSIFRQVLNDFNIKGVEIVSTADVPSGTGLGSSSAFTVGLLNTLNFYKGIYVSKKDLAAEACKVEIEKLGNPIGKQDQYAASYGGMNYIEFHEDNTVSVNPVIVKSQVLDKLQQNLIMFYTGMKHDANKILAEQNKDICQANKVNNLKKMCYCAREMKKRLELGDLSCFGELLNENWNLKKNLADGINNPIVDELYDVALHNGAIGGKLLGAGGGGFLLFYCEKDKQEQLQKSLGLKKFDFKFEKCGTKIVYSE